MVDRIKRGFLEDIRLGVNSVETKSRGEAIPGETPRMSQDGNEQMGFDGGLEKHQGYLGPGRERG